jgi:hypothetical protein
MCLIIKELLNGGSCRGRDSENFLLGTFRGGKPSTTPLKKSARSIAAALG